MTIHITQFIERIRAAESRNTRDFVMTLTEARALHSDITKLLLTLEAFKTQQTQQISSSKVTDVEISGGGF
jgi:hypothetical protein